MARRASAVPPQQGKAWARTGITSSTNKKSLRKLNHNDKKGQTKEPDAVKAARVTVLIALDSVNRVNKIQKRPRPALPKKGQSKLNTSAKLVRYIVRRLHAFVNLGPRLQAKALHYKMGWNADRVYAPGR